MRSPRTDVICYWPSCKDQKPRSTLRPQSNEAKAAIAKSLATRVWPLLDTGKVAPVIHATFPLDKAADAHALMESSTHMGKIILDLQ